MSVMVKQLVSVDFSTSVTFNLTMSDSPRYDFSVASPKLNAKLALEYRAKMMGANSLKISLFSGCYANSYCIVNLVC